MAKGNNFLFVFYLVSKQKSFTTIYQKFNRFNSHRTVGVDSCTHVQAFMLIHHGNSSLGSPKLGWLHPAVQQHWNAVPLYPARPKWPMYPTGPKKAVGAFLRVRSFKETLVFLPHVEPQLPQWIYLDLQQLLRRHMYSSKMKWMTEMSICFRTEPKKPHLAAMLLQVRQFHIMQSLIL